MDDKIMLASVGVICVSVIECFAIAFLRLDGAVLSGVVGTIAGIVGYAFGIHKRGDIIAKNLE
jgi:hypothetical protein